jgi:hypothetical protein
VSDVGGAVVGGGAVGAVTGAGCFMGCSFGGALVLFCCCCSGRCCRVGLVGKLISPESVVGRFESLATDNGTWSTRVGSGGTFFGSFTRGVGIGVGIGGSTTTGGVVSRWLSSSE